MRVLLSAAVGLSLAADASAQVINEFVFDHAGADAYEYFEIAGQPNTDYAGSALVVVSGDGPSTGVLQAAFLLGQTDAEGLWWTGYLGGALGDGSVSLLFVSDFNIISISVLDIDINNDGVIDQTFWSGILDSLAVLDGDAGDFAYSPTVLDGSLAPAGDRPGGASRVGSAPTWRRNDFDGAGLPGMEGTLDIAAGEVPNTPGLPNIVPEPATLALFASLILPALLRRLRGRR